MIAAGNPSTLGAWIGCTWIAACAAVPVAVANAHKLRQCWHDLTKRLP